MKVSTTLSASNLYWNTDLLKFFFRTQSRLEFEELCNLAKDTEALLDRIDEYFKTVEEFEEFFYNESIDTIIEELDLTDIINL